MMGLAQQFEPLFTGKMRLTMCGQIANTKRGDGVITQMRYGTGTAPTNGAALTGIAIGTGIVGTSAIGNALMPFCHDIIVAGLTPRTVYWFDGSDAAYTGGSAVVSNIQMTSEELR